MITSAPPSFSITPRLQSPRTQGRRPVRLALLALLLLAGASPASSAETALSGEEIRALISGNTLQGSFMTNPLTMVFYPDGLIRGAIGLTGSDSGTWEIKGDTYCHLWFTYFSAVRRCYKWFPQGDGYVLKNADAFKVRGIQGHIEKGKPKGY
jgi:hypothetical protein